MRIYGKLSRVRRAICVMRRRPPCGGRGLKLYQTVDQDVFDTVAPHAGGVDFNPDLDL